MASDPTIVTVTLNPAIDRTLSIPDFAIGKVNRVAYDQSHAAGKGVNVAVMLADLGASVTATGFLGDKNAALFQTLFASKRINDQFVRLPGETRTGLKIVDGGETTDINFAGLVPTTEAIRSLKVRIGSMTAAGRWFVLSGSVPAGVSATIYSELIEIIHDGGGHVLLDTSGEALASALSAKPEIAKPNVAELSELIGKPLADTASILAAARTVLLEKGVQLAVVSMGGDGAIFVGVDHAILAEPPPVEVASTVGAGDAMVAGIVFAQSKQMSLEKTATLASSLGTSAVTRIGTGIERGDALATFAPRLSRFFE